MRGKCHIATGLSTFLGCSGVGLGLAQMNGTSFWLHLFPPSLFSGIIALSGVVLGSLLPDIDSPTSMLGKHFHLPLKHRTWTHSVWAFLILFLVVQVMSHIGLAVFAWGVFFGYAVHLLMDSLSPAGICFLYPFQKYIEYKSGAFVKPNHKIKLYHMNTVDEIIFCALICTIGCGIFIYMMTLMRGFAFIRW